MDRLLKKFRDGRGVAVLEFAIVAPLLVLLVAGVFDLGNALQQEIRLYQAARAGAQFALSYPIGKTAGVANPLIVTAVQNADTGLNITASATMSCYCPGSSTSVNCATATCTDSSGATVTADRYIDIVASAPFDSMIIPLSTIRSSILERVQ